MSARAATAATPMRAIWTGLEESVLFMWSEGGGVLCLFDDYLAYYDRYDGYEYGECEVDVVARVDLYLESGVEDVGRCGVCRVCHGSM